MTTETKQNMSRKVTLFSAVCGALVSLAVLGGLIFAGGSFKTETTQSLHRIEGKVDSHIDDQSVHMRFENSHRHFVTRGEWTQAVNTRDARIDAMKEMLIRQELKIDKILEIQMEQARSN